MLVLSFCFNTLVVTYFNIDRVKRATLLDLSGTAVGTLNLAKDIWQTLQPKKNDELKRNNHDGHAH